jgi:serine/threonine protein kinase
VPHQPPDNLIELLQRLGLATRQQVEAVAGRVRRLAGDLPLFESVWVDALSQARVLTPFQAAEINAGRGDSLLVGPYLLLRGLASNGLGQCFVARHAQTGRFVRLLRASCQDQAPARILEQFQTLIQDLHDLRSPCLTPAIEAGIVAGDCWVACEHVEGICAADWLAHNGRLAPAAVLEIARQMTAALAALEELGRLHSDLGARQLILTKAGQAVLPLPGVRAILRPAEGYTRLDLLPEGYDYLAPERISAGTPADVASEMFACGCLWWHLLCGRPPLSGGDALGKVRSAQQARIADVRRYAPDAPQVLLDAIDACTQSEPRRRPQSMSDLAAQLGPSENAGRAALARSLQPPATPTTVRRRPSRGSPQTASGGSLWPTATAAMLIVGLGIWWLGHRETKLPVNQINGATGAVAATVPPQTTPPAVNASANKGPADLVLTGERVRLDQIRLQPGQTVRSDPQRRTLVLVAPDGLIVDCEDVRFENLDFATADASAALLRLNIERATFHGCSFQGPQGSHWLVAIDWPGKTDTTKPGILPAGRLQLSDCVFHRLAGVRVGRVGAVRLELTNCLHLGPGSWITLTHLPAPDEPCLIALDHCTLRGASALLHLSLAQGRSERTGEFHIRAHDCAFAPPSDGTLIAGDLLRNLRISGQGSILSMAASLVRGLPDEQVEADGLVRSRLLFAGENLSVPAESRVVSWQAPLASPDPPGIVEKPLFLPVWHDAPRRELTSRSEVPH